MKRFRHIGMLSVFALFANFGVAQTCEQHQKNYPFLRCEKNEIQYFGRASEFFETFYETLLRQELYHTERLNILHFGDSHIQADHLPNRMRHLLRGENTSWSEGDRGLIFPFTVAKTNNPHSYLVDYSGEWSSVRSSLSTSNADLGLTGMSVSTRDSDASLKILQPQNGYATSSFTAIRVFHSVGENVPKILLREQENVMREMTSKYYGYTLFLLKKPMDNFTLSFDFNASNSEQEISIFGISLESGNSGSTYSALGVNGADIKALLKSNLLEKQLMVMKPSLIILSYGVNDVYQNFNAAEFEYAYTVLIRRMRAALPNVPILLTTPGDALKNKTQQISEFSQLIEKIYAIAKDNDCAVWNFYDIMGGNGSINQWFQANLTNADKLHFLKKGYELQADLLFQALIQQYLNTLKH